MKEPSNTLLSMDFRRYAAASGINSSGLKHIIRSPAHYRAQLSAESKETPAQALGSLTHLCVLEPERYERELKAGTLTDKQEHHDKARAIRDAVHANSIARKLLSKGVAEQSLWWQDDEFDVLCKARVDFVSQGSDHFSGLLVDLKTCRDAGKLAFARAAVNYRYDLQMAHYLAGGRVSRAYTHEDAVVIAVENEKPHACVVYTLSNAMLGVGVQWRQEAMWRYSKALKSGVWEGLPETDELGVPKWERVPGEAEEALL